MRWLDDMREHAFSRMIILLIGNKDDLNTEREVSTEEGQDFAKRNNLIFFETSAKSGHNIEQVFMRSATKINDNIKTG